MFGDGKGLRKQREVGEGPYGTPPSPLWPVPSRDGRVNSDHFKCSHRTNVRFGPKADIPQHPRMALGWPCHFALQPVIGRNKRGR